MGSQIARRIDCALCGNTLFGEFDELRDFKDWAEERGWIERSVKLAQYDKVWLCPREILDD